MDKWVIIVAISLLVMLLCICRKEKLTGERNATEAQQTLGTVEIQPVIHLDGQLMAAVDTKQEAETLANQYSIRLVSFGYGIAEFYTEEDPLTVIQRGIDNGWKRLELNGRIKAF